MELRCTPGYVLLKVGGITAIGTLGLAMQARVQVEERSGREEGAVHCVQSELHTHLA